MINNITSQVVTDHLLSPFNSFIEASFPVDITTEKTKHIAFAAILAIGAAFFAISSGTSFGLLLALGLGIVSVYVTTAISKLRMLQEKVSEVAQKDNIQTPIIPQFKEKNLNTLSESNSGVTKTPPRVTLAPGTKASDNVDVHKTETEHTKKAPTRISLRLLAEAKYKEELQDLQRINRPIDVHGNTLLHYAFLFDDQSGKSVILKVNDALSDPINKQGETPEEFVAKQKRLNPKPKAPKAPTQTVDQTKSKSVAEGAGLSAPAVVKTPVAPPLPIEAEELVGHDEMHNSYENLSKSGEEVLDKHGNTLLHYALLYKENEMAKRLRIEMSKNGFEETTNKYGDTPEFFAKKYQHYVFVTS